MLFANCYTIKMASLSSNTDSRFLAINSLIDYIHAKIRIQRAVQYLEI